MSGPYQKTIPECKRGNFYLSKVNSKVNKNLKVFFFSKFVKEISEIKLLPRSFEAGKSSVAFTNFFDKLTEKNRADEGRNLHLKNFGRKFFFFLRRMESKPRPDKKRKMNDQDSTKGKIISKLISNLKKNEGNLIRALCDESIVFKDERGQKIIEEIDETRLILADLLTKDLIEYNSTDFAVYSRFCEVIFEKEEQFMDYIGWADEETDLFDLTWQILKDRGETLDKNFINSFKDRNIIRMTVTKTHKLEAHQIDILLYLSYLIREKNVDIEQKFCQDLKEIDDLENEIETHDSNPKWTDKITKARKRPFSEIDEPVKIDIVGEKAGIESSFNPPTDSEILQHVSKEFKQTPQKRLKFWKEFFTPEMQLQETENQNIKDTILTTLRHFEDTKVNKFITDTIKGDIWGMDTSKKCKFYDWPIEIENVELETYKQSDAYFLAIKYLNLAMTTYSNMQNPPHKTIRWITALSFYPWEKHKEYIKTKLLN